MVCTSNTKVIEGVDLQLLHTTTKEKQQRMFRVEGKKNLLWASTIETNMNSLTPSKMPKSLLQAVNKRFGGNTATKKTQRNLLKQQYENFTASSLEVLDQTFDRLQKLISQLEFHGESLESVEARLLAYKKNESVYEEDIKIIDSEIVENCKKGLGYNAVAPPYTGNFMPPTPDLSFTCLEEFASEPVVIKPLVENSEAKASEAKPKAIKKNNGTLIIEDWVSKSEEEDVPQAKIEKKTVKPSFAKIEKQRRRKENAAAAVDLTPHTERPRIQEWSILLLTE
ncbi:hypothetical protein Tco_0621091 [Tanacetum coccineum]